MDLRLSNEERYLLATILETHHCDLVHETFRAKNAEQHDTEFVILEQRKLLEGIMDKMGLTVRARAV